MINDNYGNHCYRRDNLSQRQDETLTVHANNNTFIRPDVNVVLKHVIEMAV